MSRPGSCVAFASCASQRRLHAESSVYWYIIRLPGEVAQENL